MLSWDPVLGLGYVLGSVENVVQKQKYLDSDFTQRLPDWAEQGSDPYLRETDEPKVVETRPIYAKIIPSSEITVDSSTPSNSSYPKETLIASESSQKHPMSLEAFYSEDVHSNSDDGSGEEEEGNDDEEEVEDGEEEEEEGEEDDAEEETSEEEESSGDPSGWRNDLYISRTL